MEDNPAEQVKQRGPREAALWLLDNPPHVESWLTGEQLDEHSEYVHRARMRQLAEAQARTALHIGDQVKALVELHRDAFTQGFRTLGELAPQLGELLAPVRVEVVPPKVSDVDPALFGYVPHRVDIDPTAQHMPTAYFARELLERDQERRDGQHPGPRCVCDPICRAITEATR